MSDKEENSDKEEQEVKEQKDSRSKGKGIIYCGVCGLPPEYCEFGPSFEKCKPWLIENVPDLYPNLKDEDENKEAKSTGKRGGKGLVKPDSSDSETKLLPGGKVKKKEKPIIHISRVQRNKRKYVTIIEGLDKFGVKLSDASKLLSKKFSCGASVVKTPNGEEEIDVQGDFTENIIEFLMEKWDIPDDGIICEDGKRKVAIKKRAPTGGGSKTEE